MKKIILLLIAASFSQLAVAQSKSWIEGGVSAISSYRILKSDGSSVANIDKQTRDGVESSLPTFGAFAAYNKHINQRLSWSIGLAYERLGYRTLLDQNDFRARNPNDPLIPEKLIFMDLYHVVRIPATINYRFIKKERFSLGAVAGVSIDIMASSRGKTKAYYYNSKKVSNYSSGSFAANIATTSFSAGIGAEYRLTEKSGLTGRLLYSQNIMAFNNNPLKLYLQWIGLNLGYTYSLR